MTVTSISAPRAREAVAVLQHLLERAQRGEIVGLALCAKPESGPEEIVFAGLYRTSPERGVNASMRMSWRLTQMQDEQDAAQVP